VTESNVPLADVVQFTVWQGCYISGPTPIYRLDCGTGS